MWGSLCDQVQRLKEMIWTAGGHNLGNTHTLTISVQVPGPARGRWLASLQCHQCMSIPIGAQPPFRLLSSLLPVCPWLKLPSPRSVPFLTVPFVCAPQAKQHPLSCFCFPSLPPPRISNLKDPSLSFPTRPVSHLCSWDCLTLQAYSSTLRLSPGRGP